MNKAKSHILSIDSLEEMLSVLRHELGNPINSLKITLDVLRENYDLFDDVKKRGYLNRASELLSRQEKLIDALKSYSKFHVREQTKIAFIPFWESFSAMASNRLRDGNIRLTRNLETEPCSVKANGPALNEIMLSILDNAIEAVENVNKPTIELKASRANGFVKIQMKDNGSGIKEDDMSKIFIPLFSTKSGKMGMGLAIARKLSWEMGGRMEVESSLGIGTEARLWLKTLGDEKNEI